MYILKLLYIFNNDSASFFIPELVAMTVLALDLTFDELCHFCIQLDFRILRIYYFSKNRMSFPGLIILKNCCPFTYNVRGRGRGSLIFILILYYSYNKININIVISILYNYY